MSTLPRLLVIMGSGETAPTMKGPHRSVFERLAVATGGPVDAVLLDTPFGFQENAPILAAKTAEYFVDAVGRQVDIAGLARTDTGDVVAIERGIARLRSADWVFAGPGSPTFALGQWRGTAIPDALVEKLTTGGAVVFSSAAALTLGRFTVPVYEIYKVGSDPYWIDGLDVLAAIDLPVVVIPHYDNKEGGNHDTSKCYLGERRLQILERELPDDVFVLGVDEHTGMIVDLDAGSVDVVGKGGITLRRRGVSERIETGSTVSLDLIRSGGQGTSAAAPPATAPGEAIASTGTAPTPSDDTPSLRSEAARLEAAFDAAIAARDADAASGAVLQLDSAIVEWSRDTLQGDDLDRARTALRSMIVRLGAAAAGGLRPVRDVLAPVVEAALAARVTARSEKAFVVSDAIRDNLTAAGVEVRDTPDGVEWLVTEP